MTPKAAIIAPLLRQQDAWLERSIRSALAQTVPVEVLVITAPATPETNLEVLRRLAAEYPRLRILDHGPGVRFPGALNLGLREAAAPRAGIILTDDWLEPTAVEASLESDADIVSTGRTFYAADGVTILREITQDRTRVQYAALRKLYQKASWLGHFFLFQKAALESVGWVDETLGDTPGVDDFDMIWSLLEREASVHIVEQRLYNMRDHPGERLTTRNRDQMLTTFNRILDKHRVTGEERAELLREHVPWFGRPLMEVYWEQQREAERPKWKSLLARAGAKWRGYF